MVSHSHVPVCFDAAGHLCRAVLRILCAYVSVWRVAPPPCARWPQAKAAAAAKFNALSASILEMKRAGKHDDESLKASMKVLELNPEFYSAWNFRREIFSSHIKNSAQEVVKVACLSMLGWVERGCDGREIRVGGVQGQRRETERATARHSPAHIDRRCRKSCKFSKRPSPRTQRHTASGRTASG